MRNSAARYPEKKGIDSLPCQSVKIFGHLWSSRENEV